MATEDIVEQEQPGPKRISIKDARSRNPLTGVLLDAKHRKSVEVNPDTIKSIVAHAKAKGVDPYTALAIAYQETGIDDKKPYNLNPDFFKKSTGDPAEGVET